MDQENELTLGEYLRTSRERANYSIEKLSLKTRINANILRSLEAEDFKSLPNPAYVKGFVHNYVKMFSLNEEEAIQKLEASYLNKTGQSFPSINRSQSSQSTFKKSSQDTEQLFNKSDSWKDMAKKTMPFVIATIIIVASFGGYKVVSNMINQEASQSLGEDHLPSETSEDELLHNIPESIDEQSLTTTSVEENEAEAPLPTRPELQPEAEAPPQRVEEKITPPAATVVDKVEKKEEVKSQKSKRTFPLIDFKDISGSLYSLKPDAPENKDHSLMPPSYKAKMEPELQNVYIHARDGETWVSYKVDDEPIQNEFIRQGKALFLQGKEIRMFFGNINVTKIFLNNVFIDAPSPTGVKTIVFPESAASKYKRPLFPKAGNGVLYTAEDYIEKMNEEEKKTGNP